MSPVRMQHFRNVDRKNNEYPHVDYPEIYLLKGGFKQFFQDWPVGVCFWLGDIVLRLCCVKSLRPHD